MVAAGIFSSRIVGFVRGAAVAHFLGAGAAADAWQAAFRIPNFLQNLFGEGALSASFIPVYSSLLGQGREKEARTVAGGVAALLGLLVATLVLLGVLATPWLMSLIAPGFEGDRRELAIRLVRIVFAWCLGVLNSHGRFYLAYASPVAWNIAIIAALMLAGSHRSGSAIAVIAAWGAVAGSALQLLVQLPAVLPLVRGMPLTLSLADDGVRTVLTRFGPAFVTRGVTQIGGYVDTIIASFLPLGMLANLGYAQLLSYLPISLFGIAVSAAELPAMSRTAGDAGDLTEEARTQLQARLARGLRQLAYFVVPSAVAFLALGHVLAGVLFQSGRFTARDSVIVWTILGGAAVGLLAATMGRLFSSAFYALRDTRTPLRYAGIRVVCNVAFGWFAALHLPRLLGLSPEWGGAGLTAAAGLAAWFEFALLRRGLAGRIGVVGVPVNLLVRLWLAALVAAGAGWAVLTWAPVPGPRLVGGLVLLTYGAAYLLVTRVLGVEEARSLAGRFRR
jgi:putative peptidoglycan lipid II flippase